MSTALQYLANPSLLRPLAVIAGSCAGLRRWCADDFYQRVGSPERIRFDLSERTLSEVLLEIGTPPLLTDSKLIYLHNPTGEVSTLVKFVQHPPHGVFVVLMADSIYVERATKTRWLATHPNLLLIDCNEPDPERLAQSHNLFHCSELELRWLLDFYPGDLESVFHKLKLLQLVTNRNLANIDFVPKLCGGDSLKSSSTSLTAKFFVSPRLSGSAMYVKFQLRLLQCYLLTANSIHSARDVAEFLGESVYVSSILSKLARTHTAAYWQATLQKFILAERSISKNSPKMLLYLEMLLK